MSGDGKKIRHILQEAKEPFNAVWKWATGHYKRWRSLSRYAADRRKNNLESRQDALENRKNELKRRATLTDQADKIHDRLTEIEKLLGNKKTGKDRRIKLERERKELLAKLQDLNGSIKQTIHNAHKYHRQAHDAKKRLAFWTKKHTIYYRKWRKARKKHRHHGTTKFETWMLNGLPNTISPAEQEVVAFVVVVHHQTITATSNGVHATGSYHYYHPCRAVDWAGADMCNVMIAVIKQFGGDSKFIEQFGPCQFYVKNGVRYPGMFPGHGDHGHSARTF